MCCFRTSGIEELENTIIDCFSEKGRVWSHVFYGALIGCFHGAGRDPHLFMVWGKGRDKRKKSGERKGRKRGFLISLLCLQDIRRILELKVSKIFNFMSFLVCNRLIIILLYSFVNSYRLILISNIHYPLWAMPFHFSYFSKYHAGYQYKGSHL